MSSLYDDNSDSHRATRGVMQAKELITSQEQAMDNARPMPSHSHGSHHQKAAAKVDKLGTGPESKQARP